MNVSANGDWCPHRSGVRLLHEDRGGFFSDEFDLLLGDGFECFEVVYDEVELSLIGHASL